MNQVKKPLIHLLLCLTFCASDIFAQDLTKKELLQLTNLADSLIGEDQDSLAKITIDQLSEQLTVKSDEELSIYYYKLLGDYYLSLNLYEEAVAGYEPILTFVAKEFGKTPTLKLARAVNDLGIAYMKVGKISQAIDAHHHSLQLYFKFNDPMGGSYNYNNLGVIYKELKKIDSAIYFHEQSIVYALQANDTLGVGFNHLNIGILKYDNKDLIGAMDHFQTSLATFEAFGHEAMMIGAKRRIGRVYSLLNDHESALQYQTDALEYYKSKKSRYNTARVYVDMADLFLQLDRVDSAVYYLRESIAINQALNYEKGLVNGYHLLGQSFVETQAYDSAVHYFRKSLSISVGKYVGMEANNLKGLAQVSLLKKRYKDAILLAEESLYKIDNSASLGNLAGTYEVLYEAHKALGNQSEALKYLELFNEKNEMAFGEEQALEIARIEYRNKLARERAMRQEQEQLKQLAYEQELARKRWIVSAVITIALLTVVIALFIYRSYRIKKNANVQLYEKNQQLEELRVAERNSAQEVIETKERELATMAMASHEKNSVLNELKQKMTFLETRMSDDLKPSLREVRKTISESITIDNSWDSFIHKFEDVHPKFFDRLKNDNPKLTINDLKLSAYLKIGMSNKEIANVSHLTLGSVKSNINRLKKKLELGPDDSVRDYIFKYA